MSGSHLSAESSISALPLPLAQLSRRAQNAKSALERHQAAYYLWEAALKLLGSVTAVEYLALGDRDAELSRSLENLARPALGHWWEISRRLIPVLRDSAGTEEHFRPLHDLLLGSARDDLPRAAGLDAVLREALEGSSGARTTVRLAELFERLVRYRNQELGHGAAGQRSTRFYERMGSALLAGVSEVLTRLAVLAGRRLVFIADLRRQASGHWLIERYELSGESARRLESIELPEAEVSLAASLPRPGRVYLEAPSRGAASRFVAGLRSLHPLVLFDQETGEFFFLAARRGEERAQYLSYSSGRVMEREDLGADQRELFASIAGRDVAPETAREWAARSRAEEAQPGAKAGARERPLPLRSVGEFEILSRIGRGGMGVVYRALQPSLGREVALKCVLSAGDPRIEARFAREIRSLGRVEHPNLVKVFTSGSDGDQWFYAMELIEGADLASVCDRLSGITASEVGDAEWHRAVSTACDEARRREEVATPSPERPAAPPAAPLEPARKRRTAARPGRAHIERAVDIVRQAALAAHALHEAGVIHRDIKPGNIVLTGDGEHAVLMDLGLAQIADDADGRLTRTRQFVGTLRYASPEQVLAAGNLDRRADIYSLGATLWELLTLRRLFGAGEETPTPDLMLKIQSAEPDRPGRWNPHVPPDLEAIALKCLEKDRARRYETAAGLAEDLARWRRGEPVEARPPTVRYLLGKYARRHRMPIAAAAAVLTLALLGTVLAFVRIDRARRHAEEAQTRTEVGLFDSYTSLGIEAGEGGNPARASLWFANAASLARGDARRQEANRVRFRAWSRRVPVPVRAFRQEDDPFKGILFQPGGEHILALSTKDRCRVWRIEDEAAVPLPGGERPVSEAVWSPKGDWLALGTPDGKVDLHGFPGGEPVVSLSQPGRIECLAFSPRGDSLAIGSDVLRVWDASRREYITDEVQHPKPIHFVVFNGRGDRVVTASEDGQARVFALGKETGSTPIFTAPNAYDPVMSPGARFNFIPAFIDEDHGLLTSGQGEVTWWDLNTGAIVRSFKSPSNSPIRGAALSPDARCLALTGWFHQIPLFDLATGRLLEGRLEHRSDNTTIQAHFSADGTRLFTGSADGAIKIWAPPGRRTADSREQDQASLISEIQLMDSVGHLAIRPDGRTFASTQIGGLVNIWRFDGDGEEKYELKGTGRPTASLSQDGTLLVQGKRREDATEAQVHEVLTGDPLGFPLKVEGRLQRAVFSPDGKRVLTLSSATGEPLPDPAKTPGKIQFWDWRAGREVLEPVGTESEPRQAAYDPSGKLLVILCAGGQVVLLDPASGRILKELEHPLPDLKSIRQGWAGPMLRAVVCFSPDGKTFVTAGMGKAVQVWDTELGAPRYPPFEHDIFWFDATISRDGKNLASASWGNLSSIVDLETGRPAAPPLKITASSHSACFSPDGNLLLTSCVDGTAKLWDWRSGKLVCPPFQHENMVWAAEFSPDGRWVLSAGFDRTLRTWETFTGKPVVPAKDLTGAAWYLFVTPDGRRAVVSNYNGSLNVFDLGDLAEHTGEELEPVDLRLWGEILAAQRIHESGGGVVNLNAEDWFERWKTFRKRHPELPALRRSRQDLVGGWHRRRARALERDSDFEGALWHLNRLKEMGEPVDPRSLLRMQQPVRSWRFAPRAEPWTDRNAFVDLDDEKLQAIEASALSSIPVRSRGPFIDFAAYHGPKTTDAAGYVAREIRTSEPRTLRILAGSDDAIRVWVNRKLVHANLILRGAVPDQDSFEARLEPGTSTLLVEVSQTTEDWGLYLRLEDDRGQGLILGGDGTLEPAR